jgi:CRP-like cAMP-binding protein
MRRAARVLGAVFRNRDLRRVELAFVGFNSAEWGVWIAMLVYAYEQGGATTAGIVAAIQLVPAGLVAPFGSALADRYPPVRMLVFGYVAQAAAMGATAIVLLVADMPYLAYALAAVAATAVTITRPTQSALVPALARSPDELTATNVVSGWIESLSVLLAPALTGVILGFSGPGTVFAVMAVVALGSGVVVAGVHGPGASVATGDARPLAEITAGFRVLKEEPGPRLLVGLLAAQFVAIGALDVLYVVLAIGVLELGQSGAGYLNAAFGAGGVLGIGVTVLLVGRRRLLGPLVAGVAAWCAALAVLGAWPTKLSAFVLLAAAGAARSLVDVAGRTLLQRTARPEVLARVFGVLEGLTMAALAIGSLLTPALVAIAGAKAALLGLAVLLPLALAAFGRQLRDVDRRANVPVVEISLLRTVPIFSPLGAPELEALARSLEPVEAPAGAAVVREGDPGDLFYAIAGGELEVTQKGRSLRRLGRGDVFGEIALLQEIPRTATVTALSPAHLYSLEKEPFLAAVTGHPQSAREATTLVRDRLETLGA